MVARITGVDIPHDKRVIVSLVYIYGIGNTAAEKVLADVGIFEDVRVCDLTNEQADATRAKIDKLKAEGDLRHEVDLNIRRLMEIGSHRGVRRHHGLPTRGQNTKNNAHTRKGPIKTVAGKKK